MQKKIQKKFRRYKRINERELERKHMLTRSQKSQYSFSMLTPRNIPEINSKRNNIWKIKEIKK